MREGRSSVGNEDFPNQSPSAVPRSRGIGGSSGSEVGVTLSLDGSKRKDADKIEGIPAFPSVAAWPGWRRTVYRCTAAAAGLPQNGVDMLLAGEAWTGEPEDVVLKPAWYKIDALLGKELKRTLAKEVNLLRQVCTVEDRALRTTSKLLPGLAVYIMIFRHFRHDQRLAKAQAMEEMQQ